MIGGRRGKNKGPPPKSKEVIQREKEEKAILTIQCCVRVFLANRRCAKRAKIVWQRVFDPTYKKYFYYQKNTKESQWKQPKYVTLFTKVDTKAALNIEKVVRGFIGRMRMRKKAAEFYSRFFDPKANKFYWYVKATEETTYKASAWLKKQEIELPPEDQLIYDAYQKIKELEGKLKEKDKEIKQVRQKRFEELEPEIILDKVGTAKVLKRSKHMDEWKVEELAAWFTELKMEEYIPFLFQNRVDGMLFINLADDDWSDMGITSKFHIRKLQLILKGYRYRYQKRKAKVGEESDEDDIISEYTPSELSGIIAGENDDNEYESGSEDDEYDDLSDNSDEQNLARLEEEARLQAEIDEKNIVIKILASGDDQNFPIVGDIVRVRYTCLIRDSSGTEKVIMSTKNVLQRPWVEFVLGIDQVIKGFDRALPQMSLGERSKLMFSPEYAYGAEGLPPHIPPNSTIAYDLTLLGFRPRVQWVKPLIQDANTKEKPYDSEWKNYLRQIEIGDNSRFTMLDDDEGSAGAPRLINASEASWGGEKKRGLTSFSGGGRSSTASDSKGNSNSNNMSNTFN